MSQRINHEKTNKNKLLQRPGNLYDWRPLVCSFPSKCDVCNKWINKGAPILWNIKTKNVMHKADCLV
jgi:hypothetical protein